LFLFALIATTLTGQAYIIIAGFNRLNAQGWNRKLLKTCEKIHILGGCALPVVFFAFEWWRLNQAVPAKENLMVYNLHFATQTYMVLMSVVTVIFTPMWIAIRPQFVMAKDRFYVASEKTWRPNTFSSDPYSKKSTKLLGKLPRNEIAWTDTNHKTLVLDKLPEELKGFKIAHLSDVHLTGQLSHEFYMRAFDWIMAQCPDLIVLSGDIVDYDDNIQDIPVLFEQLSAPKGCYFVLGNHDRRLTDPMQVCASLSKLGWQDAGERTQIVHHGGREIQIVGNERPWFNRRIDNDPEPEGSAWRLGIAHSPDQFTWGIERGCSLLLCGHTHGGQIRLPLVGPLVSPSMHGSKYASGVFYCDGTLMHVSRGMAGIHPLRWGCPPEVSVLHLS
jgi:predicted MPP superfamily phosphohydrolase